MLAAARAKSRVRMCCFCGGTDMGINDTVFWNFSGHCKATAGCMCCHDQVQTPLNRPPCSSHNSSSGSPFEDLLCSQGMASSCRSLGKEADQVQAAIPSKGCYSGKAQAEIMPQI